MDKLLIRGGRSLTGTVDISGAKNAALPELCAALLTADTVTLQNVPRLQDVVSGKRPPTSRTVAAPTPVARQLSATSPANAGGRESTPKVNQEVAQLGE